MTIEDLTEVNRDDYRYYYLPDSTTDDYLFKVHIPTLNSFTMTDEEKELGLRLCLEARIKGCWKGDILER